MIEQDTQCPLLASRVYVLRCAQHPHPYTLTYICKHNYHDLSLGGIFFMILPRTHLDRHLESPFKHKMRPSHPPSQHLRVLLADGSHSLVPGSLRGWDSGLLRFSVESYFCHKDAHSAQGVLQAERGCIGDLPSLLVLSAGFSTLIHAHGRTTCVYLSFL